MSNNSTCVAVYSAPRPALAALAQLQGLDCKLEQVSVLAHVTPRESHAHGFSWQNGKLRLHGPHAETWQPFLERLGAGAWLHLPGAVTLVALGHVVVVMMHADTNLDISGGFAPHGAALHALGIPRTGIAEYEAHLLDRRILLLVHGAHAEVGRACEALHSERQQVTVHIG